MINYKSKGTFLNVQKSINKMHLKKKKKKQIYKHENFINKKK